VLSQKLMRAIQKAEANLSSVEVGGDSYIVGAFDLGDETLALMSTRSKSVAEQNVTSFKQLPDVHTVVVERPGRGMKVWIYAEYGRWRSRVVQSSSRVEVVGMDRKLVAEELVLAARELVGMEFPTEDALKKYLKDHPKAEKSKHSVKKPSGKSAPAGKTTGVSKEHSGAFKKTVDKMTKKGRGGDDDVFDAATDYAMNTMGLEVEEAHGMAYDLMKSIGRPYKG